MNGTRLTTRLVAVAVVTLIGAGACTFDPRDDPRAAGGPAPGAAGGSSGVNVSPGPGRSGGAGPATPRGTRPPTPRATRTPGPTATGSPTRSTAPGTGGAPSGCPQGERQRAVETYLARLGGFGRVTVDGRQSTGDCAAIKRFQRRYGIEPAVGRAGPTTADVARRLATTDTAACRAGTGTTFFVDLTRQAVWVMRDGRVVLGPTVTRTGMAGYATPAGTFAVDRRATREWSNPYEVWLPYWQHFVGGMGFHQTTTYLHDPSIGSHGCVNLLPADARRMYELGALGTRVRLIGHRAGT